MASLFQVGELISSCEELFEKMERFKRYCFVDLWIGDSRTIKAAQGRVKKELNPALKYYELKLACVHGGRACKTENSGKTFVSYIQERETMGDLEDQEPQQREACSGLKAELIACLKKSDCMVKDGKTLKECLAAEANVDADCKQTQYSFFECRRSMLDMRNRFRGRKGY